MRRRSAEAVARLLEHLGSDDMLLFSSDYPHWHFDGDDVLPDGLPDALIGRMSDGQSHRHLRAHGRRGMTLENSGRYRGRNREAPRAPRAARPRLPIIDSDVPSDRGLGQRDAAAI